MRCGAGGCCALAGLAQTSWRRRLILSGQPPPNFRFSNDRIICNDAEVFGTATIPSGFRGTSAVPEWQFGCVLVTHFHRRFGITTARQVSVTDNKAKSASFQRCGMPLL